MRCLKANKTRSKLLLLSHSENKSIIKNSFTKINSLSLKEFENQFDQEVIELKEELHSPQQIRKYISLKSSSLKSINNNEQQMQKLQKFLEEDKDYSSLIKNKRYLLPIVKKQTKVDFNNFSKNKVVFTEYDNNKEQVEKAYKYLHLLSKKLNKLRIQASNNASKYNITRSANKRRTEVVSKVDYDSLINKLKGNISNNKQILELKPILINNKDTNQS